MHATAFNTNTRAPVNATPLGIGSATIRTHLVPFEFKRLLSGFRLFVVST